MSDYPSTLRRLVDEGNRAVATQLLLHHSAFSRAERATLRTSIEGRPPSGRARVFAPLIDEQGPRDLTLAVELVDRSTAIPATLTVEESTRAAIELALDDAWRLLGARGPRPTDLQVDLSLPAEVGFDRIRGGSLYLPTLLSAVSRWGDAPLTQNVFASGHPGEAIDDLGRKLALASAQRDVDTSWGDPLIASSASIQPPAVRFDDVEGYVRRVFRYVPWHHTAESRGVHVFCGARRSKPPRRVAARHPELIDLPEYIDPGHLDMAFDRLLSAIGENPRVELSIGGPLPLAFFLGGRLKNQGATVRFVHNDDDAVWWSNKTSAGRAARFPATAGASNRASTPPVVGTFIGRNQSIAARVPAGWHRLDMPDRFDPSELANCLQRSVVALEDQLCPSLMLDQPLPFAWALGLELRNRLPDATLFHYAGGTLQAWCTAG